MSGNVFLPGRTSNTVRTAEGKELTVPAGWAHLPPGDAAWTRRVKAAGEHWLIQEKKGRKIFSGGLWAPAATIARIEAELKRERSTEQYAKKREADQRRRNTAQAEYVEDFTGAVRAFLAFHPRYSAIAQRMAIAIAEHATPVGSGTVARTQRIPIERRAEAAVIAWMRHQTTAYDNMAIPRVKGKRREVRRMLAQRSHVLLQSYRRGEPQAVACPLQLAVDKLASNQLANSTAVAKPAVAKPVVAKPVVAKPVVAKPVVAKPVTAQPADPSAPVLRWGKRVDGNAPG
jgi:hypothetical protein